MVLVGVFVLNPRRSAETLGQAIASDQQPGDTLVALHAYPFDLGFYAHSTRPAWVVDDWSNPDIPLRDNWRKELYDAGKFDPATAARVLVSPQMFTSRLCARPGRRFWIWGEPDDQQHYPVLHGIHPLFSDRHYTVWRIDITPDFIDQRCGETPKGDSPEK